MEVPRYIFARIVYSIEPFPTVVQEPVVLTMYRAWAVAKFDLDQQDPSKYMALERGVKRTRHLANTREIVARFEHITRRPWILTHGETSLIRSAQFFNQARILFAVHGAGCVNILYMQRRTVFMEVQSSAGSFSYWNISRIFGSYHLVTRVQELEHNIRVHVCLDLSLAQRMLEIGLQQLAGANITVGTGKDDYM
jgi:capsular polysaccharide biosynthesis protein